MIFEAVYAGTAALKTPHYAALLLPVVHEIRIARNCYLERCVGNTKNPSAISWFGRGLGEAVGGGLVAIFPGTAKQQSESAKQATDEKYPRR